MERIWRGAGEAEDGSREETRRRPNGRPGGEWRGLGLPAIRATGGGRRAADLRGRGGAQVGVERIWQGAGEAEAERRRRRGGAAEEPGRGMEGG